MRAIIRIRPKTGATNEVAGIVASEPPGLKLRKTTLRILRIASVASNQGLWYSVQHLVSAIEVGADHLRVGLDLNLDLLKAMARLAWP